MAYILPQVFNIEALVNPNVSVAGSLLRVRPAHFAEDERLPQAQQAARSSRVHVTPGQPSCVSKPKHHIWSRTMFQWPAAVTAVSAPAQTARCVEEQRLAADGQHKDQAGTDGLVVPSGLPAEDLSLLLKKYAAKPWLHFTNVTAAFSGFARPTSQDAFRSLLSGLVTEWCCRDVKKAPTAADGHAFAIRPWGSVMRLCASRVKVPAEVDKVNTYFC